MMSYIYGDVICYHDFSCCGAHVDGADVLEVPFEGIKWRDEVLLIVEVRIVLFLNSSNTDNRRITYESGIFNLSSN